MLANSPAVSPTLSTITAGGRRSTPVVRHRDVHPGDAGGGRQDRADEEAERRAPPELVVEADDEERHDRDDRDRLVLLAEVGRRAFLHGAGDLLHALVARGLLEEP